MDLTKILKVNDKVYSPIGGYGTVLSITHTVSLPIKVQWDNNRDWSSFTKDGKYYRWSPECLLFPSKENRDWDTFKRKKEITFKPFDKVLVRDSSRDSKWRATFYSHYDSNVIYPFITVSGVYKQCIPYNSETEHLVGTSEDCPLEYKFW